MKKYLEQRVEELELEVKLLRAKFKLEETKNKSTSSYLNNYPKYDPLKTAYPPDTDYMYNSHVNLMSEPDLETAFPPYPHISGSWDEINPEDAISVNTDTAIPDWGFVSEFDKMDKDFLEWLKSDEAKNAYEVSKRITTVGQKNVYRSFKVK
jgi:hypothetical protein